MFIIIYALKTMMQYVMKVNSLTKNNPSSSSSKNDLYECLYKIFINKSIIDLLHSVSVVLKGIHL